MANIITRRSFLKAGAQAAIGMGLASLMNVPPFLKRALAEGSIGVNGKKLLFIFLRGGNDGVNNVIPVQDPSYYNNRADIGIPKDPAVDYSIATGSADPISFGAAYPYAVRLGNGFAGLNPALVDLVPLFNAGDLALVHRTGYRSLSRSHFDSERYFEKGSDGTSANRLITDGLWYRTIVESGWNRNHALSGVSIQSNLPMSLRGTEPMTNLSSINRYNLLGVYSPSGSTNTDRVKMLNAIDAAALQPYPPKDNRSLVYNLGIQFRDTLDIFQSPTFQDPALPELFGPDPDGIMSSRALFPRSATEDNTNSALRRHSTPTSSDYGFIGRVKSCAQILAETDAVITGTEMGGFDTHTGQTSTGTPHLGGHANLLRRLAWAYYALWQYFTNKNMWDKVVIVTMSEFGRTSAENANNGTDHGEASVMYIAGGGVNGGVYGCDLNTNSKLVTASDPLGYNWLPGTTGKTGALFSADTTVGYLRRTIDYRSVLGEIIRDHLGATQGQLNRIIPAYANESAEHLLSGGLVGTVPILGEVGVI